MKPCDHELMIRLAARESDALAELVRRWEGSVSRVLSRLVPTTDVEDLRQEVFVRVLTASGRYQANGDFSAWLFRIVINLARDAARRRRIRKWLALDSREPLDGNDGPCQQSSRQELAVLIESALAALPARLREVLVLRHFTDLTTVEIAKALNKPPSTIKSRIQAALKRLHAELARHGVTEEELER